ncbi:hypothetical protein ACFVXQ_26085, partial [Kitasatospora sp. NPDC058263]
MAPEASLSDVLAAVERAVEEADGPVLAFYVGHGLLGPGNELYLATRNSTSETQVSQAIPYRTVRGLLGQARAGSAVVLDCCFSGLATAPAGRRGHEPYAAARADGGFLLTSASRWEAAFAPPGEPYTLFTGRLLRLLRDGDPDGAPRLTLDAVHSRLAGLAWEGFSRPRRQSDGSLGALELAPNRAYRAAGSVTASPPADLPCPYPGMASFVPGTSRWFFGREDLVRRLTEAVTDPAARHPVVLLGASGVGKSSLLGAGLVPALERRSVRPGDGGSWLVLNHASVGPHPLRALAERLAEVTDLSAAEIEPILAEGRFPAELTVPPRHLVLVIDQFEEVFTTCQDTDERSRFIRLLCAGGAEGLRVVLALRADYYAACLAHPPLSEALEHGRFTVLPMTAAEVRASIE